KRMVASERSSIGFAGADPHGMIEVEDENLAVSDLASFCGLGDRTDNFVDVVASDCHFDLYFRDEADGILTAAIDFRVALLPSIPFDFRDGEPFHPDVGESLANFIELEGLDDCLDDLHSRLPNLAQLTRAVWAVSQRGHTCELTHPQSGRPSHNQT